MEMLAITFILLLAFFAEYIDSSLGMGYGTLLSPILILVGFQPLLVIPSILLSQALASFSATRFHQKYNNVAFHRNSKDLKIALFITCSGILAVIFAVIIAIELPSIYLNSYIGLLVLIMGAVIIIGRKFLFSWKKLSFISIISAFNKAMSGSGFGPVVTSGQILTGIKTRNAVGISNMAAVPVCIGSFVVYIIFNGIIDPMLPLLLTIGALAATPLGPMRTMKLNEKLGRKIVGVLAIILGAFILIKTFLW